MAVEQCSTFVFFDTETTGLPTTHSPRITELSFCAVERSQFLNASPSSPPRVTNRLNICIDPIREIEPAASKISGLSNESLELQSRFNEETALLLTGFLKRLKGPVCLVAHGGESFDFPLLKWGMVS